jgi:hypothetical protein
MSSPWLKFYPSAWRADPALRMCSIAARGFWMELLCVMHEAQPRGSLLVNGNPVTEKQLAGIANVSVKEAAAYMAELEAAGVFSREDNGTVYSRRMRRDEEKAQKDKENGKGGGNPRLKGGVNPQGNPPDKAKKLDNLEARGSDPNGSGADAPLLASPVDRIWAAAPELAALANRPEQAIRKFLGQVLKEFDPEAAEPAVSAALSARSGDPCGYITRTLKPAQAKAKSNGFAVANAFEDFDPEAMKRERRERELQAAGGTH